MIRRVGNRSGENYPQPRQCSGEDDLAETAIAVEIIGEPGGLVSAREAGAVTHRALRIDVDEQRFHSAARECGGEIYCGSGFANSSLLAYDSEDSSHLL